MKLVNTYGSLVESNTFMLKVQPDLSDCQEEDFPAGFLCY